MTTPERPRRFRLPRRSSAAIARDVDAELGFHLEMRVAELTAQGVAPDDALRRAREEFGDIERTRQYCRDVDERAERAARTDDRLGEWRQDVRYAFRTLRRSPGFATLSLLTLALAIGANTAIFSVAHAVLLAPLPYGEPAALVEIFETWPGGATERAPLSPPNFVDYRARQRTFDDVAAYYERGPVTWLPTDADPTVLGAVPVAPNLFRVLRTRALHGRTFAADAQPSAASGEVVVSYAFWQRALGGDAAVVGRRIVLDGRPTEVIGVMPRGFTLGLGEDVWTPLDMTDDLAAPERTRKQHYVHAIGRLRAGATIGAARADLQAVARQLAAQYPDADAGRSAAVVPLRDSMTGDLRPAILLLQGASALVLLIACANLANLTLSRTAGRRRELALRAALGAGRARLARQLLTESLLLALVGGGAGVGLAVVATRTLLALNPDALPTMFAVGVDGRVLAFSLALSVGTGLAFGLVPAIGAARAELHDAIKAGGRGAGGEGNGGGARMRRALVVAQVGLAVTLLVGAGLLVRSFAELVRVPLGFDPAHVLAAELDARGARYDSSAATNRLYDGVLADVADAPGVVAVGAASILPTQGHVSTTLRVEGEPADEAKLPEIKFVAVRGDYFRAMGIPLLAGRTYDARDLPDGPKTVIVNEAAARRFFPSGDAVGRRIRIGPDPAGAWMTVVGVVGDIRDEALDVPAKPTLFANHRQETWLHSLSVVVRTAGDPRDAVAPLRRAVRAGDPTLALRNVTTLDDLVGASVAPRRFALGLATCFAVVALLLAAVGIYGVLAYAVTSRRREFGVRLALGATARSVLVLVLGEGVWWTAVGLALGVAGALAAGRLLGGMLYGVGPVDAPTYVSVVLGLLLVAGAASLVPAIRATRVDPLTSMRAE